MKHTYNKIALALIISPAVVHAGPPVAYDGWNVNNGVINSSASCSATGVSCRTIAEDNGFKYEEVTKDGLIYLRTLMSDPDANGQANALSYSGETYVPFSVAGAATPLAPGSLAVSQGLASKEVIRDPVDNFVATSEIQKGNMRVITPTGTTTNPDDMFTVRLSQSMSNADLEKDEFTHTSYSAFADFFNTRLPTDPSKTVSVTSPDTDRVIGSKTDISQRVFVGDSVTPDKRQSFDYRQRGGVAGNGYANFGGYIVTSPITTPGSITLGGKTVNWIAGDEIRAVVLAQSNMNGNGASIGFEKVEQRRNTTQNYYGETTLIDSASSLRVGIFDGLAEPLHPTAWNSQLGPEPVFTSTATP